MVFMDASAQRLGAVLSQEGDDENMHPIFSLQKVSARQRNHVPYLEVFAMRRFHMFIYGLPTVVMTDHQPLTALFKRTNVSARVLRWFLELQRYNLEIKTVRENKRGS